MSENVLSGNCDWELVSLSIVIAFCASYTAIELTGRTLSVDGHRRLAWLIGGATALAIAIITVHYLGLLAFHRPLPGVADLPSALLSLCFVEICSFVAMYLVGGRELSQSKRSKLHLIIGSIVISCSVAAGSVTPAFSKRPSADLILIASSSLLATATLIAALYTSFGRDRAASAKLGIKLASAALISSALAVVQLARLIAIPGSPSASPLIYSAGDRPIIAANIIIVVVAISFALLGFGLLVAAVDRVLLSHRGHLQSQQERWNLLMSAREDGLFDFNLVSGVIFYSPRWKEILGYAPEELEDALETWKLRLHPDDKPGVDSIIEAYLKSGHGTAELEYRLRHRDGTWRWILARGQAVWNEAGQPIRLVGSHCDITARKRAQEELMAGEARFSAFMQHNPCLAIITDSSGKIIYTNQTVEKVWNLRPNEWIGKTVEEISPGPAGMRLAARDQEVLIARARSEMIEDIDLPGGAPHQFLTTRFTFPDANGGRAIGRVSIDITERARSQEELRASESRYRELFESNPLPSWIYRARDFRIVNVNQAAIDHFGWSRAQFLNLTAKSLLASSEPDATEFEPLQQGFKTRRSKAVRYRRNKMPDIWVELSAHEFETSGNALRHVIANDVTERVSAEEDIKHSHGHLETLVAQRTTELQTSEAKWRSLVESLPQVVWSARPDGFCEYVSSRLSDYTGVPNRQLDGWGWLSFVHPSDRENVRSRWTATIHSGDTYEVEYRIRSKDGSYRWFLTQGIAMRSSETGSVSRWLGTTTDIEHQQRHKEQLETAVAERTIALAEARDRAEAAARTKSEFLASMSHEIRTPMNGVIGMTNMLLDTVLTSEQRSYLGTIRSCGDSLLDIINDVLDFSKIEAGKMQLENVEFDLQTALEETVELMATSAEAKNLTLSLNVADNVPFNAVGDPGKLRQILLNLLSNAVKFTNQGSVSLSVFGEQSQQPGQTIHLRFEVRDTGIGLTPEEHAALFQPFVQADRSTTRRFGGTGLGLSIVKRLVELNGGRIGVVSQPGEGSTFWFSVGLAPGASPICSNLASLANLQVLLLASVGESSDHYAHIRRYLERAGLRVLEHFWHGNALNGLSCPSDSSVSVFSLLIAEAATLKHPEPLATLRSSPALNRCPFLILGSPSDCLWTGSAPDPLITFVAKPVRCGSLIGAVLNSLTNGKPNNLPAERQRERLISGAEILVVEDNQVNQLVAKLFLGKLGCNVSVANNGAEACSTLQDRSFDLILMDCQMPEMDGFEATRTIRSREAAHNHRTPIVALSAGVLKEERDRCFAAGMDDFLSKPIGKAELESALNHWLANRKSVAHAAC